MGQRALASEPERQELCFVIGPIGEVGTEFRLHADWLLKGIIRPVFNQHFPEFKVERADEIKATGNISSQIITRLTEAKLVIADMSLHNANAFYETCGSTLRAIADDPYDPQGLEHSYGHNRAREMSARLTSAWSHAVEALRPPPLQPLSARHSVALTRELRDCLTELGDDRGDRK